MKTPLLHPRLYRKTFFFLALSTCFGVSALHAEEHVVGGNFENLDAWGTSSLPSSAERVIADKNSPFTEVNPSNGKCLKLKDSPDRAHLRFLEQPISPATGNIVWSFDYMRPATEEDVIDPGFALRLSSGNKNHTQVRIGDGVYVNHGTGKLQKSAARIGAGQLQRGVWYHFRCEIDLTAQTLHGVLTSETGEEFEIQKIQLAPSEGADRSVIDGIVMISSAGASNMSQPILIDNLSVQQLP
jgi:hypothetical protein